jgi:hypothetical protein
MDCGRGKMKSKIDYWTRQFLDIYKRELYNMGFEKDSAAEKMLVTTLMTAFKKFSQEVKK